MHAGTWHERYFAVRCNSVNGCEPQATTQPRKLPAQGSEAAQITSNPGLALRICHKPLPSSTHHIRCASRFLVPVSSNLVRRGSVVRFLGLRLSRPLLGTNGPLHSQGSQLLLHTCRLGTLHVHQQVAQQREWRRVGE